MQKRGWYFAFVLGVLFIGVLFWGYQEKREKEAVSIQLENQYRLSFYQLVDEVENLEVSLAKSLVSNSPQEIALELSHIWRNAYEAQNDLSRLPLENAGGTQRFFSQIADFSYNLGQATGGKTSIPADLRKNMETVYLEAKFLSAKLHELEMKAQGSNANWNDLQKKVNKSMQENDVSFIGGFSEIQNRMLKYPGLTYDGPFSNHIKKRVLGLQGKMIDVQAAEKKVQAFFSANGDLVYQLSHIGETKGLLPSYIFERKELQTTSAYAGKKEERNAYVEISKQGGEIVWMMADRPILYQRLNFQQALKEAQKFLAEQKNEKLVLTSYVEHQNALTFSFALQQDGIVFYPDLIKLKVALDDGQITALDSKQYLMAHHERDLAAPRLTAAQAKTYLNPKVTWQKTQLVLIPKENQQEVLCYECTVQMGKTRFLVYLNADTGKEEKILRLIEAKNVHLAM